MVQVVRAACLPITPPNVNRLFNFGHGLVDFGITLARRRVVHCFRLQVKCVSIFSASCPKNPLDELTMRLGLLHLAIEVFDS